MREFMQRKERAGKIFGAVTLVLLLLWVASLFLMIKMDAAACFPVIAVLFVAFWTFGIIYLAVHQPFVSCVKWLRKNAMEHIADDIDLEKPTFPESKLFCGQRAMYSKKSKVIIPYGKIAWTYLHETRTYGITVERYFVIHTTDRKKFMLKAKLDTYKWLLENRVAVQSPNLIVGFGKVQKKQYLQCTQRGK